jgi:hypothetical protein
MACRDPLSRNRGAREAVAAGGLGLGDAGGTARPGRDAVRLRRLVLVADGDRHRLDDSGHAMGRGAAGRMAAFGIGPLIAASAGHTAPFRATPCRRKPICRPMTDAAADRFSCAAIQSVDGERRRRGRPHSRLRLVCGAMRCGHLQHGCALAFAELGHQHVAAVGKFDRVMMPFRDQRIDLAEFSHAGVNGPGPDPAVVIFDVLGERQLGSRK